MTVNLSPSTIATVKATIPVLEEHGTTIASVFYNNLFARFPITASFFNRDRTTPDDGISPKVPTQVAALAGAVIAYAKHIEDVTPIMETVERICHKHVSRNVRGPHYNLVGKALLDSMKEVLRDACTDDVLSAWGEAYTALAATFIETEARLRAAGEDPATGAGFAGYATMTCAKVDVHGDAKSFSLTVPVQQGTQIAAKVPPHHGGQYVSIAMEEIPDVGKGKASFMVSDISANHLRFTVFPSDEAATKHVLNSIHEGDNVSVSIACGPFRIDAEACKKADNVFVAGMADDAGMVLAIGKDVVASGVAGKRVTLVVGSGQLDDLLREECAGMSVKVVDDVSGAQIADMCADAGKNCVVYVSGSLGLFEVEGVNVTVVPK